MEVSREEVKDNVNSEKDINQDIDVRGYVVRVIAIPPFESDFDWQFYAVVNGETNNQNVPSDSDRMIQLNDSLLPQSFGV